MLLLYLLGECFLAAAHRLLRRVSGYCGRVLNKARALLDQPPNHQSSKILFLEAAVGKLDTATRDGWNGGSPASVGIDECDGLIFIRVIADYRLCEDIEGSAK